MIAVHTAAAPRVSMVVETPAEQPEGRSTTATCLVTIDGQSVPTSVTPMVSGDLAVALVIDTASGLTAQELAAVQSGATEYLLRLPYGAHTMVVNAGGPPEVVAPLSEEPAQALSTISALRVGGERTTMAATMLAAESLESAQPGARVIIVYSHGSDDGGPLVSELSQAVLRAGAVVNVIRAGVDNLWPWAVEQTGGVVLPPTEAAGIVESYEHLATTLGDQYFVTFQAPGELPASAQVAFRAGAQEFRTVVTLPSSVAEEAPAAEPDGNARAGGIAALFAIVVAGLAAIGLVVFVLVRRARGRALGHGSEPAAAVAGSPTGTAPLGGVASSTPADRGTRIALADGAAAITTLDHDAPSTAPDTTPDADSASPTPAADAPASSTPPDDAASSTPPDDAASSTSLSDEEPPGTPLRAPTPPVKAGPARTSLSAAVEGRRLAQLSLTGQVAPQRAADEHQQAWKHYTGDPLGDLMARYMAYGRSKGFDVHADTESAPSPPNGGSAPTDSTVLTGSGGGVVALSKNAPGPAAIRIGGNEASEHFAIRAIGSATFLVETTDPYEGVRALDWEGSESTDVEVIATGPWRIEVVPLAALPTFDTSFAGNGDLVLHFTGDGSVAEIIAADNAGTIAVRTLSRTETYRELVTTTAPYTGSCPIDPGPQFFAVEATGPWTISVA